MAALRQLLNARGITRDDSSTASQHGYSISPPVPEKSRSSRTLHSKFNDVDSSQGWQHPLLRKSPTETDNLHDSYTRSNSFDNTYNRPAPLRSATETNLHEGGGMHNGGYDPMDTTSMYEDNDSPTMSPALHKHLQLRPLQTQAQENSFQAHKQRRRSRSTTDEAYHYTTDPWDSRNKDMNGKPRKDSLMGGSSKPLPNAEESASMQLLRDRVRSPIENQQSRFNQHNGAPTKVAHIPSSSDGSPTDYHSNQNSVSDNGRNESPRSRKRIRDLDYTIGQMNDMDYQQLKDESFDHVPQASKLILQHHLPDASLPLNDRLHHVYSDKTQKDKALRARGFFASLTIDQYEECGDLLLDGFRDVMDRLKQARQQKRKAAKIMEEQIAKREEWVRRKRGICEVELGRLKSAGSAVVKPLKNGGKSSSR